MRALTNRVIGRLLRTFAPRLHARLHLWHVERAMEDPKNWKKVS